MLLRRAGCGVLLRLACLCIDVPRLSAATSSHRAAERRGARLLLPVDGLRRAPLSCGQGATPERLLCAAWLTLLLWRQVASELEKEEGISGISMGRQVEERRTVAQARSCAQLLSYNPAAAAVA